MNLKKILLYIFAGFSAGAMSMIALEKFDLRSASFGGEALFLPLLVLLFSVGWVMKGEYDRFKKK